MFSIVWNRDTLFDSAVSLLSIMDLFEVILNILRSLCFPWANKGEIRGTKWNKGVPYPDSIVPEFQEIQLAQVVQSFHFDYFVVDEIESLQIAEFVQIFYHSQSVVGEIQLSENCNLPIKRDFEMTD